MENVTIEVSIPQENYELLVRLAQERDQSAGELLEHLTSEFLEAAKLRKADYRAVRKAQGRFPGEYVAIRQGQILAHASQANTLMRVVQDQFGLTAMDVLPVKLDWPDLRIRHPRLIPS